MSSEKIVTLSKENFESAVIKADKPVLVDFWAPWCGPCRMVGPIVEELAEDFAGKAVVAKLNVDEANDLAAQYKVMSIPTLMVFKDGAVVEKIVGARPKSDLEEMLERHI